MCFWIDFGLFLLFLVLLGWENRAWGGQASERFCILCQKAIEHQVNFSYSSFKSKAQQPQELSLLFTHSRKIYHGQGGDCQCSEEAEKKVPLHTSWKGMSRAHSALPLSTLWPQAKRVFGIVLMNAMPRPAVPLFCHTSLWALESSRGTWNFIMWPHWK